MLDNYNSMFLTKGIALLREILLKEYIDKVGNNICFLLLSKEILLLLDHALDNIGHSCLTSLLLDLLDGRDACHHLESIRVHTISEKLNETSNHFVVVYNHHFRDVNQVKRKHFVYFELLTTLFVGVDY